MRNFVMRVQSLSNQELSLSSILDAAKKGDYAVPKFQRDYVWTKAQRKSLADSVVRGYPIGSLLLMPTKGSLNVSADPLKALETKLRDGGAYYVMDGQQRLTSMYIIFSADDPVENYYYDLLSMLAEMYPDEDFESMLAKKYKGNPNIDTECLCLTLRSREKSKNEGRFVRCREIAHGRYLNPLHSFIEGLKDAGVDEDRCDEFQNELNTVLGSVAHFAVPVVYISSDSNLEIICRIFEKVNTSGTKLVPLDLINAKTHGAWQDCEAGITSYVSDRITSWAAYRSGGRFKDVLDDALTYDVASGRFTSLGPLLKALHIASLVRGGSMKPKVTTAMMLEREAETWFSDWNAFEEEVLGVLQWGVESGLLHAAKASLWELLLGIAIGLPEAFRIKEFKTAILKYAYSLIISDTALSRQETNRTLSFVEFGVELAKKGVNFRQSGRRPADEIVVQRSHVEKATLGRKSYRAIMAIMYDLHFKAGFSVDITGHRIGDGPCDEHHLVTKASGRERPLINSVANIVYLNPEANRYQIRDCDIPEMKEKVLKILHGDEDHRRKVFEANLIPESYVSDDQFLSDRTDLVLKYVNDFLQPYSGSE
jgi:hypothetical protein